MLNLAHHFKNAIQPLVHCALDLAPAERGAWLRELRADCPSVARELERLMLSSLDASPAIEVEMSACHIVSGSPEHLGLRC